MTDSTVHVINHQVSSKFSTKYLISPNLHSGFTLTYFKHVEYQLIHMLVMAHACALTFRILCNKKFVSLLLAILTSSQLNSILIYINGYTFEHRESSVKLYTSDWLILISGWKAWHFSIFQLFHSVEIDLYHFKCLKTKTEGF